MITVYSIKKRKSDYSGKAFLNISSILLKIVAKATKRKKHKHYIIPVFNNRLHVIVPVPNYTNVDP